MPTAGRPCKLNKITHAAIVESVKIGASYATAAGAAGIAYDTFREWIKQGEADSLAGKRTKFSYFSEAIRQAEFTAKLDYTKAVHSAIEGRRKDWRAAVEFLRRRDKDWGDPPPPAPVNALQSIITLLPKPYLDRILAGEPVDVVFAAWASEQLQAKKE